MKKLLLESWIRPFFLRPIHLAYLLLVCIVGIKNFSSFWNMLGDFLHRNRVVFFKTIYFNMRSLPFKQAIKFPIFIYTKTEIISAKGNINIETDHLCPGLIQWGRFDLCRSQGKTRICNDGEIIFHGEGRIIRGCEICVFKQAVLDIGKNFFFGENTMIYCQERITIGKYLRLAYHSQIFDSDFHYSINMNTGEVHKKTKPVVLGDYNWIGNKCTIKKGTKTPNHITIAGSYSVLSKDYTKDIPAFSILGGIPAKLLVSGYSRLWNNELPRLREIDGWFARHENEKTYVYNLDNTPIESLVEDES